MAAPYVPPEPGQKLESNSYINIFSGLQSLSGMVYPICHSVRVTKSENMPSVVKTEQFKEAL